MVVAPNWLERGPDYALTLLAANGLTLRFIPSLGPDAPGMGTNGFTTRNRGLYGFELLLHARSEKERAEITERLRQKLNEK